MTCVITDMTTYDGDDTPNYFKASKTTYYNEHEKMRLIGSGFIEPRL